MTTEDVAGEAAGGAADGAGEAGDVQWNFEKFLLDGEGNIVARFRPMTDPESPEVVAAIEENLPA